MSNYQIKPPASLPAALLEAFRDALAGAGIAPDQGQAVVSKMAGWFQARAHEIDVADLRATHELQAALASAHGPNAAASRAAAKQAAQRLGFNPDAFDVLFEATDKIEAASQSATTPTRSEQVSTNGSPASAAALQSELNRLEDDRDFMRRFLDPRHPRHEEAVAERQALIERMAQAQAADRTAARTSPVGQKTAREQLEQDPEFMKVLSDPRHPDHAAFAARRNALIAQEAGGARPERSELRAQLQQLDGDPATAKALSDARHPQHQEVVAGRQRLIEEIAAE